MPPFAKEELTIFDFCIIAYRERKSNVRMRLHADIVLFFCPAEPLVSFQTAVAN